MNKPFLKWAGGKTKVLPDLDPHFDQADVFVEPFCGAGVVWLNTDYEKYVVADINQDIINLFKILKKEGAEFIKYCHSFFQDTNNPESYAEFRDEFNTTTDLRKKSALFIYLNRHGFNGLCRYNLKGKFNVPRGKYKTIYFPEKEMLHFAQKAQKAEFYCESFEDIFDRVKGLDCVMYCDPPYIPISDTSSFTAFVGGGFNYDDQVKLRDCISSAKHKVIASNSHMARDLYQDFSITEIDVRRNISAKGSARVKVKEIIAVKEKQLIE